MPKFNLKILKPVLYYIVSFIIIVTAAIGSYKIYSQYSWLKNTREQAEAKLTGEVNRIQKFILSIEQIPQNLEYVLEFSNLKREEMKTLMTSVVENTDEVFGTCIAFEPNSYYKDSTYFAPYVYRKDGQIISVNPTDSSYHYFSMDWYLIPRTLNKPVWIEPYYDEGSSGGNIVLATYSVPFYYYDGLNETLKGIIAVDISLDWLSKVVSSIKLKDESYSILVSENGTIISSPNPHWPYNESLFSLAEENNQPVLRAIGRDLQKGNSGFVDAGNFGTDRKWWICYKPIPANKWGVLLVVPKG